MLDTKDLAVGQFVKSKAGRDKGRIFVILEIVDCTYLLLADGELRKVEKPKRKKVRHVSKLNSISVDINELLSDESREKNSILRREIEKLGGKQNNG